MKITEVDVQEARIVDGKRAPRPGVHLSDILQYIRKGMGSKFSKELSESDFHRFLMGEAFESGVMARGLRIKVLDHHPHRWAAYNFVLNDIALTTDAVCFECEKHPLVWEVKLTWFGTKKEVTAPEFWIYHVQLMAYVYALQVELQKKVVGRFVFGYVNGNYTTDRKPRIRAWDIHFTEPELHNNWKMILRTRDEMASAGLLKGK